MASSKKCQVAVEYLMIVGFIVMILTPLIYIIYSYSQEYGRDIALAQAYDLGSRLVDTAESLYYFGEPSRIVLDVTMPSGINEMTLYTQTDSSKCSMCTELRFRFSDRFSTEIAIPSRVLLAAADAAISSSGTVAVTNFTRRSFSPGLKRFQLTAFNDRVEIIALS